MKLGRIRGMSTRTPHALADAIDAALPQTQCRRCGYDGCRPYAEAVAAGAPINRCPPGGDALIATLAALTGRARRRARSGAAASRAPLDVARIDEATCIGCTLCIDACPVDAIVGAAKRMHTVLPALCTGCELCIPPCPVDCIAMVPAGRAWSREDARAARERYVAREPPARARRADADRARTGCAPTTRTRAAAGRGRRGARARPRAPRAAFGSGRK